MKVKTCITCKWMESSLWYGTGFAKCNHPEAVHIDLVSGKTTRLFCSLARACNDYCWQDGKWWESK